VNDVWPPPPQNQPASEPTATISSGGIGPVLVAGLGASMLVVVVAAAAVSHLAHFKFSSNTVTLLVDLILISFPIIVVGAWAGYYTRDTKNGRAAIIVGCAAIVVFGLFCLLPTLFRYL